MKHFLLSIILFPLISFSQSNVFKTDSTYGYILEIPSWLSIKKTNDETIFGGTLPAIDKIENAILIKGFPKSAFKSYEEFKQIYLTGNKFGQPTKYSNEHIWYGQNDLITIPNGVEQKVFLFWRNKIYHSKFVLLETSKSFIWVQFMSTPETYDKNIEKFNQFMTGLKLIEN